MKATFKIEYHTKWGESLFIAFGENKIPMTWNDGGIWTLSATGLKAADLKDYTYLVVVDGLIDRTEWEHHSFDVPAGSRSVTIDDRWIDCPIPGCPFPRKHSNGKFDMPGFRGAGTAVPLFSLRTADDFGIGEFRDLHPLVDWAASTGQCIIQLLPVNDTTRKGGWEDSYPYSPVSSFALHPLYVHLQDLGVCDATPVDFGNGSEPISFGALKKELNALEHVDYPRVFAAKTAILKTVFATLGAKQLKSAAYRRFAKENAFWLDEYSEFCAKRDGMDRGFYGWVQFHLDLQFSQEVEYARSRGVCLKGDLPIGVSADSAEAYFHPELFNLDSCAGAPPDFFSRDGQNWGFPTYDWDEMAKDGYAWWKARLRKMSRYFDAFRIDHILGFFRIWEIPVGYSSGMMGHFNPALPYSKEEIAAMGLPLDGLFLPDPRNEGSFQPMITPSGREALSGWQKERFDALYTDFFYHRHDGFWRKNAMKKLPELLGATGMLACGEDLGMVPDCVYSVMDHEKILSLEMACVQKGHPWPALSVCATSSHDMETIRMRSGHDLDPASCEGILCDHLQSVSMLAIFPIQDWLSIDGRLRKADCKSERVNDPSNPHHHWRYRLHFNLESLAMEGAFNEKVRVLLARYGRQA